MTPNEQDMEREIDLLQDEIEQLRIQLDDCHRNLADKENAIFEGYVDELDDE